MVTSIFTFIPAESSLISVEPLRPSFRPHRRSEKDDEGRRHAEEREKGNQKEKEGLRGNILKTTVDLAEWTKPPGGLLEEREVHH